MTAPDYLEGVVVEALERATARLLDAAGPRAYTAAEVAERLGVSDDTVYRLINDGRLPVIPHLPKRRVSVEALALFMRGDT